MKNYDIEYDSTLSCYILHYAGESICLGADNLIEANEEAEVIISTWVF